MEAALAKMTVAQLKDYLNKRGLESTGKKADLVERLQKYLRVHKDDELVKEHGEVKSEEPEVEPEVQEDEEQVDDDEEEDEEDAEKEPMDTEETKEEEGGEEEEEEDEKADVEDEQESEDKPEDEVKGDGDDKTEGAEKKDATVTKKEDPKPKKGAGKASSPRVIGKNDFRKDMSIDIRNRSLVVGPILPEDLKREEVIEFAKKSCYFTVRVVCGDDQETMKGHIEYRFKTREEAIQAEQEFPKLTDDFVVKRLKEGLTPEGVDREIRGTDQAKGGMDCRTISAYNIPLDTSEEQLRSLFTDSKLIISKDNEGTFKGAAYLEYPSTDEASAALKKLRESDMEIGGKKLYFIRLALTHKEREKQGLYELGEDEEEIMSGEKRGLLMKERRELINLRTGDPNSFTNAQRKSWDRNIYRIEARLDKDNEERERKGLEVRTYKKWSEIQKNPRNRQMQQQGRQGGGYKQQGVPSLFNPRQQQQYPQQGGGYRGGRRSTQQRRDGYGGGGGSSGYWAGGVPDRRTGWQSGQGAYSYAGYEDEYDSYRNTAGNYGGQQNRRKRMRTGRDFY